MIHSNDICEMLSSIMGYNRQIIMTFKFTRKISFRKNVQFGPNLVHDYASLHLMIWSTEFFEIFQHDRAQKEDKSNIRNFPPKNCFRANWYKLFTKSCFHVLILYILKTETTSGHDWGAYFTEYVLEDFSFHEIILSLSFDIWRFTCNWNLS